MATMRRGYLGHAITAEYHRLIAIPLLKTLTNGFPDLVIHLPRTPTIVITSLGITVFDNWSLLHNSTFVSIAVLKTFDLKGLNVKLCFTQRCWMFMVELFDVTSFFYCNLCCDNISYWRHSISIGAYTRPEIFVTFWWFPTVITVQWCKRRPGFH